MRHLKLLIIVVLGFISLPLFSQQQSLYNLYPHAKILINPAYTGDNGYLQAFLDSRNQWVGIKGGPKTRIFGIQSPLDGKMSLGGIISSDKLEILERTSINVSYAYMIKLNDDQRLTFGLSGIMDENRINFSNVQVSDYNDFVLTMSAFEGVKFDAGFGLKYNLKKFEAGFSVPYIFQSSIRYNTVDNTDVFYNFTRHFNLFLGYTIDCEKKPITLEPSILYRDAAHAPSQLDLNLISKWDDKFWVGLGYRNSGRTWVETGNGGEYREISLSLANSYFLLSAGINIKNNLGLAYSYEISNSELYKQSNGTHEIMLAYTFGGSSKKEKNYDVAIDQLTKNQKGLITQIDSLNAIAAQNKKKADDLAIANKANKQEMEDLKKQISNIPPPSDVKPGDAGQGTAQFDALNKKIDDLKKQVDNLPPPIDIKPGDEGTAIAQIDALNKKIDKNVKQTEALVVSEAEKKKQIEELQKQIDQLRKYIDSKPASTITPQVVTVNTSPSAIDFNNIYFSTNSDYLTYDSRIELQKIIIKLLTNQNVKVEIAGHADELGDDNVNMRISDQRAQNVYKYLIKNGIDKSRMTFVAYGEKQPSASNQTYEGRSLNRRVEIRLLN